MRNRWLRGLVFVFAWIAIGLIFSYQLYLLSVLNHMKITWQNILAWELTRWCLWMVFYGLILRTIRRAAQLRTRLQFVITNGLASIVFSLAHMALFSLV